MRFPGAQPVSLEPRRDLTTILNNDFKVCEKTDGIRHLFFLDLSQTVVTQQEFENVVQQNNPDISTYETAFFVDREYNFYLVKIKMKVTQFLEQEGIDTYEKYRSFKMLLDGELVMDTQN